MRADPAELPLCGGRMEVVAMYRTGSTNARIMPARTVQAVILKISHRSRMRTMRRSSRDTSPSGSTSNAGSMAFSVSLTILLTTFKLVIALDLKSELYPSIAEMT
jgi:hypothetical protein